MQTTTDLKIVKKYPKRFAWGKILKFYNIENYTIAKYREIFNGEKRGIEYHCWVNGEDLMTSVSTLEEALAIAIAKKFDGINSQAGYYFMKMIGK